MPATLLTPQEIIKKKSVFLSEYDVKNIFINIKGESEPYIRVEYDVKDVEGNVIDTKEVILQGQDLNTFLTAFPNVYNQIKVFSYNVGKAGSLIPQDADVT